MEFITYILTSAVRSAIPLTLAGLGGVLSERAGIMNLALEGQMLMGAFFGVYFSYATGSPWLGVLGAMLVCALVGLVMAVLSIRLCANQIVVATAINLISVGITGYCLKMFITNIGNGTVITVPSFRAVSIPVLSSLPFLGEVLFSYKPLTYVTILLAVLIHIYQIGRAHV